MFTKLIGVATLFAAGSVMASGSSAVGATPIEAFGSEAALTQAGDCSAKEAKNTKEEGKTPDKAKAKDGSCGKGSCGSKDMKKDKKDGSCGKDKKDGSCGKDKKKEAKDATSGEVKK